jgi:hypothetical protein
MRAIVYPIVTGRDWCEPDPPIPLDHESKASAIRALREHGYRIMWRGGCHDIGTITAQNLRDSRVSHGAVRRKEQELARRLSPGEIIRAYSITVWPR